MLGSSTSLGMSGVSLEFTGVGTAGQKRRIVRFEYLPQGPIQRLNATASVDPQWQILFNQWGLSKTQLTVSLTVLVFDNAVLKMDQVIPLYYGVIVDTAASKLPITVLSFGSYHPQLVRASPTAVSELDRYMPAAASRGIPTR